MRIWEGKGRRGLKGVGKGGKDLPQVKGGMKQSLAEAVMERRATLMAVMVENFILDLKFFEYKFEFEFVSGCSVSFHVRYSAPMSVCSSTEEKRKGPFWDDTIWVLRVPICRFISVAFLRRFGWFVAAWQADAT